LKKFLGKYKFILLGGFISLILFVVAIYGILSILPDTGESIYGGRLEGIEEHTISDEDFDLVTDLIKENEFVLDVNHNIQGKIINYLVYLEPETDVVLAKALADILLENFSDEQKSFFDMQIFLIVEEEVIEEEEIEDDMDEIIEEEEIIDEGEEIVEEEIRIYPKIGYKHRTSVNFVWTN